MTAPDPLAVAAMLDRLADGYDLEYGGACDRTREARRMASLLRAPAQATPVTAPDAGGGAAFAEALDAFERAVRTCHDLTDSDDDAAFDVALDARRDARAALLALHAAAVDAALQSGWHAGLDEGQARRDGAVVDAYNLGVSIEREASLCAGCGEPLGELCFACNDDMREIDAESTPPALVNGGPATDALDDGR